MKKFKNNSRNTLKSESLACERSDKDDLTPI